MSDDPGDYVLGRGQLYVTELTGTSRLRVLIFCNSAPRFRKLRRLVLPGPLVVHVRWPADAAGYHPALWILDWDYDWVDAALDQIAGSLDWKPWRDERGRPAT